MCAAHSHTINENIIIYYGSKAFKQTILEIKMKTKNKKKKLLNPFHMSHCSGKH